MSFSKTFVAAATIASFASGAVAKGISATPHDKYSSSIGVLGCKIDTNRVAYWPQSIGCDNICVKLTYKDRSVNLLRIDQSGGAYDISYDAWVYLQSGQTAAEKPMTGGGVPMEYEEVDASECADLILTEGHKLPLTAANSMNYLVSCLEQPDSFVAKNHALFNIADPICTMGYDEECDLDLAISNQPSCPHTLGLQTTLKDTPVYDIAYQTGETTVAGTGEVVDAVVSAPQEEEEEEEVEEVVKVPSPVPSPETPEEDTPTPTPVHSGGVFVEESSNYPRGLNFCRDPKLSAGAHHH